MYLSFVWLRLVVCDCVCVWFKLFGCFVLRFTGVVVMLCFGSICCLFVYCFWYVCYFIVLCLFDCFWILGWLIVVVGLVVLLVVLLWLFVVSFCFGGLCWGYTICVRVCLINIVVFAFVLLQLVCWLIACFVGVGYRFVAKCCRQVCWLNFSCLSVCLLLINCIWI